MKKKSISFDKLLFQKLFRDYTKQHPDILQFFESDPYSDKAIENRIHDLKFKGDRKKSAELLKKFNKQFDASDKTLRSVEKISLENSVAVVTGQQVTLMGGPLFTIYKTLTAINLAKYIEKNYNIPAVPVFWMADEDHDFEEVNSIKIPEGKKLKSFNVSAGHQTEIPSAEIEFNSDIEEVISKLKSVLHDTEFSPSLWNILTQYYKPGSTFANAFAKWMLHLFEDHGLIVAGSNFDPIKKQLSKPLAKCVSEADKLFAHLEKSSENLENYGYHRQVHLQKSNIFWLDENRRRRKLKTENGTWSAEGVEHEWTREELVQKIKNSPEQFSPNVFLRPVLQDYLLPNAATVAGSGEVAYYAQMKEFYHEFGINMPLIYPRISVTLMESGIDRIFGKLPFSVQDYSKRIEDLESEFVEKADTPDIESIFDSWKKESEQILESKKSVIGNIDPTLVNSAEKANAIFSGELDKLKGKVYRSVKQQEKVQINRIKKIQQNLFPDSNLQEREFVFIYFMNKYGLDIWDKLLEEFESEDSKTHKVVCL